jgi:hypothetical protein
MENLYQGRCNVHIMGAYCWKLHREIS